MSQIHSAEEFEALSNRVESLTATVLTLTHTVSRQNDFIEKLLQQLLSQNSAPRIAPTHIPPVPKSAATSLSGDLTLPSAESSSPPSHLFPAPSLPSLRSPSSQRVPPRRSHKAPSNVTRSSNKLILPAPTPQIPPISIVKPVSTRCSQSNSDEHLPGADIDDLLKSHLLWWWFFPNEDSKVSKPLREWTSEERPDFKDWRKVELAARGWHLMKGHTLKEHALEQEERPILSELKEDLVQWRRTWGNSFHLGTERIRDHLKQRTHLYPWAPKARNRRTSQAHDGDILNERSSDRH